MEQLKNYESPEMEVILIDDSDVITASGLDGGIDVDNPFANNSRSGF